MNNKYKRLIYAVIILIFIVVLFMTGSCQRIADDFMHRESEAFELGYNV